MHLQYPLERGFFIFLINENIFKNNFLMEKNFIIFAWNVRNLDCRALIGLSISLFSFYLTLYPPVACKVLCRNPFFFISLERKYFQFNSQVYWNPFLLLLFWIVAIEIYCFMDGGIKTSHGYLSKAP